MDEKLDYSATTKQKIIYGLAIILLIFLIGKMFYGSFRIGIFIIPLGIPVYILQLKKIKEKNTSSFEREFKDMLVSLKDSVLTGYSLENALRESYKEMLIVYGERSNICRELKVLISRLSLNISIEKIFDEFANRTGLECSRIFANSLAIAKRSGGDLSNVIKRAIENIVLRETVKEEIEIAINGKKMEQKIMTAIPILMIGYISLASPGFLSVMYETWMGRIVMSICLMAYIGAYFWSEKIVRLKF